MNDQFAVAYDPARVKRIARETTPFTVIVAFVFMLMVHARWWFMLPVLVMVGIGNYWFWRGCGYIASRLMRRSG